MKSVDMKDPVLKRQLIFISHANPQDNDATIWLASKLSLEGYEVWSDLTKLFGGDLYWDNIEEAIRKYSCKFIVLVSANSQNAQGVLDEVQVAITTERNQSLPRFVIPIRLDNLPFEEFKANIIRKWAIDFSSNWVDGLSQLINLLNEDKIPKKTTISLENISNWYNKHLLASDNLQHTPELLCSNWLKIQSFPETIQFSRIPVQGNTATELVSGFFYPSFLFGQFIGSFASSTELQQSMPKWLILSKAFNVTIQDFLDGSVNQLPNITWRESHNYISNILKKAWDTKMEQKGLVPYVLSNQTIAWYFPTNFFKDTRIEFVDIDKSTHKKVLVGRSNRYDMFWHFGMSARPHLGRINRFTLRAHIIFTKDGNNPIANKDHMHTLRRGFCRNWWNETWRRLLLAYLKMISDDQNIVSLPVSPTTSIIVSTIPCEFFSEMSIPNFSTSFLESVEDDMDDYGYNEPENENETE
jgi:hypothetical protein